MTELSSPMSPAPEQANGRLLPRPGRSTGRIALAVGLWVFVLGNLAGILWIWGQGGDDQLAFHWHSFDEALIGLGRLTALVSGYLALIEVVLLARLPFLERMVGFDRLTVWHRWNGHAVIDLALAHVLFSVWGYARQNSLFHHRRSWFGEYWNWLSVPQPNSPYPGIITATIGTALLVAVLVTSLVVVRRKMSYEWWYAVHFTAYAGIALAWFHMIPDGNELVTDEIAADYWKSLYVLALALVVYFRLLVPIVNVFRWNLHVTEVTHEGPGVVSMRISGRRLDRLGTRAGQFFFWRFLAKGFWYTQHPFSLSMAPKGDSFRITVKDLGDHTAKFDCIRVGTRVITEGPFGVFTDEKRSRHKALLIAGGIGITPVRALLEEMDGDIVALYRVIATDDIVFSAELAEIARTRGVRVDYVVGDHATDDGRDLLSPEHLNELVPDLADREVYLCGPPAMIDHTVGNLRRAGVARRHLHVERFAL
jgi:predicted ferric reductase